MTRLITDGLNAKRTDKTKKDQKDPQTQIIPFLDELILLLNPSENKMSNNGVPTDQASKGNDRVLSTKEDDNSYNALKKNHYCLQP